MRLTPRQAAQWFRDLPRRLEANVTGAVAATLDDALETARRHSQGPYSLTELAQLGHPYAIRHLFATQSGGAPFGGTVINYQSGLFYDLWFRSTPSRRGDGSIRGKVFNTAPYASFLENGTLLMWARPINHAVALEVFPRFQERLRAALIQTFTL